jgi:hypothetical protein
MGKIFILTGATPLYVEMPNCAPKPDAAVLVEAMKLHGLFRTGPRGLYYNRHLLPEPFNTMGRDRLEALTRTQPASRRPAMRSIQRHIGAAQRMLDDLRGACACPALRAVS